MELSKRFSWWGPPEKFDEQKTERKVSWLELFFDLVYVAAIGQLTYSLATHLSWQNALYLCLLFSLIFWSWVNGSEYYDMHGVESLRTRLMTFWQMLSVAALAISVENAFNGHHREFAIGLAVIEAFINYLWWSVGIYDPSHREFSIYFTVSYSFAFVLLIISVFTTPAVATAIWIVVLILNLSPPLTGARTIVAGFRKRGLVFSASAAIVERFGQFTIIVLAESVLATVTGLAGAENKSLSTWAAFIVANLISFELWNVYFDMTSEQQPKKNYFIMWVFIFLHYPLLASLAVEGACIRVLLTNVSAPLTATVTWLFCLSMSLILFLIVCLSQVMEKYEEDRAYIVPASRWLVVAIVVLPIIPVFRNYLNALSFLGIIAVVLFVPIFIGGRGWVKYKFFGSPSA